MRVPVDKEARLRFFDLVSGCFEKLPEQMSGAEVVALIAALLDVAGTVALASVVDQLAVLRHKAAIDTWQQEAMDALGRIVHEAKKYPEAARA